MKENIEKLMNERLEKDFESIENLELGSKERAQATEDLTKLYRAKIESDKLELDRDEKYDRRTIDLHKIDVDKKLNEKKIDQQRKDTLTKEACSLATFGLGCLFYGALAKKGFKFEELGSITSNTGRRVIDSAFRFFKK